MKSCRPERPLFDITLVVTLSSLIVVATLATIIEMDNEMITAESAAEVTNSARSQHTNHSIFLPQIHANE